MLAVIMWRTNNFHVKLTDFEQLVTESICQIISMTFQNFSSHKNLAFAGFLTKITETSHSFGPFAKFLCCFKVSDDQMKENGGRNVHWKYLCRRKPKQNIRVLRTKQSFVKVKGELD